LGRPACQEPSDREAGLPCCCRRIALANAVFAVRAASVATNQRPLGYALAATAAVSYGSAAILAKGLYAMDLDWPEVIVWRFGIAAALSWTWVVVRSASRAALARTNWRTAFALLVTGSLFSVNASGFYAAIQMVSVSLAVILQSTYPSIVAVLSTRFGHLARGPRPWIAVTVAFLGVVLVIDGVGNDVTLVGIVLAVSTGFIYAFYCILSARLAGERRGVIAVERSGRVGPDTDSAVAAALMLTGTWLVVFPLAAIAGRPVLPSDLPAGAWPGLVGIGIFSAVANQAFYAGTARIGVANSALVGLLDPVVAVILAAVILGERLGPSQIVGAIMVFLAVFIAESAGAPPARERRT
jgi:drug/metabolite transporter (DMT)-like permease